MSITESEKRIQILESALGVSCKRPLGFRNHFVAGEAILPICQTLVQQGLMAMVGTSVPGTTESAVLFNVTEAGRKFLRNKTESNLTDELLADRIREEAVMTATESVSPNSFEHDGLCDRLELDPAVQSRAQKSLLRELLALSLDMHAQLLSMHQLAGNLRPESFEAPCQEAAFNAQLTECEEVFLKAKRLLGVAEPTRQAVTQQAADADDEMAIASPAP